MRLIDADALMRTEAERCGSSPIVGTCTMNNRFLHKVLDEAPTIDAEPVKHGEWVADPPLEPWHCSVCGFRAGDSMFGLSKFCPNCGAKMDGGENGKTPGLPVVRRKDCIHRVEGSKMCMHPKAVGWDTIEPEDDDFCSYGERRNNNDD